MVLWSLFEREEVGEDDVGACDGASAADACNCSADDEGGGRRGGSADDGSDFEGQDNGEKGVLGGEEGL